VLVLGAAFAAGTTSAAAPGFTVRNSVVLTRADGVSVPVAQEFRVRCGRWARDVPTPSVHVIAGDGTSAWHLAAVVADVRRRPVVRFPHAFIFDKPTRAQISGGEGRNEFNSDQEESSGRHHVQQGPLRCKADRHPLSGRRGDRQRALRRHVRDDARILQRPRLNGCLRVQWMSVRNVVMHVLGARRRARPSACSASDVGSAAM